MVVPQKDHFIEHKKNWHWIVQSVCWLDRGLDDRGTVVWFSESTENPLFCTATTPELGLPCLQFSVYKGAVSPEVNLSLRTGHSPPSGVEAEDAVLYSHVCMTWCLHTATKVPLRVLVFGNAKIIVRLQHFSCPWIFVFSKCIYAYKEERYRPKEMKKVDKKK